MMRWKENRASTLLKKPRKNMFQKEEMIILMNSTERSMGFITEYSNMEIIGNFKNAGFSEEMVIK